MGKQLLLNRNEVIQGPAPECIRALKQFPRNRAALYFEGYSGSALVPKLSKLFGVPQDQVIVGYGAESILKTIFDAQNPKSDVVLTSEFHYTFYDKYLKFRGVRLEKFRMLEGKRSFAFDVDDCIAIIKKVKPTVVLITSPNNPTGNSISAKDFSKVLDATDRKTLVVLDEAYIGFNKNYEEKKFLSLLKRYDNLVILRSFSKLYALAGFRIGFALCGKGVKNKLRYQDPYLGGSRILEAVAIAALEAKPYYQNLAKEIVNDRTFFNEGVNKLNHFTAYDSNANFVMVKATKKTKELLEKKFKTAPFLIAKFVSGELMRVSIGSRKYTASFLKTLQGLDKQA
jgi:histidinol-phosphate aminotransferase